MELQGLRYLSTMNQAQQRPHTPPVCKGFLSANLGPASLNREFEAQRETAGGTRSQRTPQHKVVWELQGIGTGKSGVQIPRPCLTSQTPLPLSLTNHLIGGLGSSGYPPQDRPL